VSVGLIGLLLAGGASAQQGDCCKARLEVCRHDIVVVRENCGNDCYLARQADRAGCNANPVPFCLLGAQIRFALCLRQCKIQWGHDLFDCGVTFKQCVVGRLCENSPTATRTETRTATPSHTPERVPVLPVVPSPTPTPPPS